MSNTSPLLVEDPPNAERVSLSDKLARIVAEVEPGTWVRLAEYATEGTARRMASTLRTRARGEGSGGSARVGPIPPKTWEFKSGRLPENKERGGVWTRYLNP